MKKIITTVCLVLGLLLNMSYAIANDNDPVSMVQTLADKMIASLKTHQASLKKDPKLVYSLAYKIVVPCADLDEMSSRVLPPQTWNNATPNQRAQFKSAFTDLLVRTYAAALADYTDQKVRFFPIRGNIADKDTITVNSQIIRSDGPSVAVNYRLHLKGSEWKLYDLSVEGVSLLQSFREQFRQKLSQGNMDQLLQELNQRDVQRSQR